MSATRSSAGAQSRRVGLPAEEFLHKELLETIRAVHAGKKALSAEASYQLAEHATDDALTRQKCVCCG
jgi:hypothetical protein